MGYKAIIDLGSLKAKLSVFEACSGILVLQKIYLTLLGKRMGERDKIIAEALQKLDDALGEIEKELGAMGEASVFFIATESLRSAENKADVFNVVKKHFPGHEVTILNQDTEGGMFFKVVATHFKGVALTCMDIGGGSVQILHGHFDHSRGEHVISEKHLHSTGTYRLQQKYSPQNDVISIDFHKAVDEVRNEFRNLNVMNDVMVFGSTCMQDFLKETGIPLQYDRPIPKHDFYVKKEDLRLLLEEIRKYPPNRRDHFYPSGGHFIHGADYLLVNLLEALERTRSKYIYPTNLNSSYGFI